MVTANQKGARGETVVRDKLRLLTNLQFERVPSSGALDPKHGLKGDLYIPNEKNLYAIEVKNYEEDHLTSKVLSSSNPQLVQFWEQAIRQGKQVDKKPLLLFKFARSKVFAAYQDIPTHCNHMFICSGEHEFYVSLLDDWITLENPKFI